MTKIADNELLKLAGNAVVGLVYIRGAGWIHEDENGNRGAWWNPLENSAQGHSDCLQMEIDLDFDIERNRGVKDQDEDYWVISRKIQGQSGYQVLAKHSNRQRASTMAAAKIGEAMKNELGK